MRRLIVVMAVLGLASPVFADSFGARLGDALTNPMVIAGPKYLVSKPAVGNQLQFVLTANVPGFRVLDNFYVGGVGLSLNTVVPGLGDVQGAGISVPAVTYFFGTGQFCAQAGYAWDLSSTPSSGGVYVGVGFGFNSVTTMRNRRIAREEKAKKAQP